MSAMACADPQSRETFNDRHLKMTIARQQIKAFIAHLETAEKLRNSFAIIASWRSVQPTVFVSMNSSTTKSNTSSPSQFRVRDPDPHTYVSTNFSGPWFVGIAKNHQAFNVRQLALGSQKRIVLTNGLCQKTQNAFRILRISSNLKARVLRPSYDLFSK